ncbi:MAG: hypothetical protein AAFX99_30475, partial [Myxococcota bacterium]
PDALIAETVNVRQEPGRNRYQGRLTLPSTELPPQRVLYWKVIAMGARAGARAETDVWSMQVATDSPVWTPCPDQETVEIDGRNVETVEIDGRCWTRQSFLVGERAGGPGRNISYDDGVVQYGSYSGTYAYSWYELHNAYLSDGNGNWEVNMGTRSTICPDGWRLPVRSEWERAVQLGNALEDGRPSSALDYGWVGHLPAFAEDVELCEVSDGVELTCVAWGEHTYPLGFEFHVGESRNSDNAPAIFIKRPDRNGSDYTVQSGNVGSPFAARQVRCVRRALR